MSLEEKLLKDFSTLPEDKKLEVIEFVEFLKSKNQTNIENMMDRKDNFRNEILSSGF